MSLIKKNIKNILMVIYKIKEEPLNLVELNDNIMNIGKTRDLLCNVHSQYNYFIKLNDK